MAMPLVRFFVVQLLVFGILFALLAHFILDWGGMQGWLGIAIATVAFAVVMTLIQGQRGKRR